MSMVKQLDKRSGITYVYESVSYWDKEKKQPRSKRTLIGRLDPTTGEIVPTDGRGKRRAQKEADQSQDHHFKWWFDNAPIRGKYLRPPKGGVSKACYWPPHDRATL